MASHLSCLFLHLSPPAARRKRRVRDTERDCGRWYMTVCMSMCVPKCTSLKEFMCQRVCLKMFVQVSH